jgi:hypothetical protein
MARQSLKASVPDRVISSMRLKRVEDELPVPQERSRDEGISQRQERRQALEYPPLGIA